VCPFCSERILDQAKKCKHCGEWLDGHKPAKGLRGRRPACGHPGREESLAISGLGPFGENHIGLMLMPDRFVFVNGKHGPNHVGTALMSMGICVIFCLPLVIIMLIALPFDLTGFKRRRERVWAAFEDGDLAELMRHPSLCKSFPVTAITVVHFSESQDKIYIKANRLRIKVECSPEDREAFQEFALRCRSVSRAADTTFFSFP
jgi:hypothetical protein